MIAMTPPQPVTQLLVAWGNGDETARDELMRRILVDYARSRNYLKRGGALQVSLDETLIVSEERAAEVLALDDVLKGLAEFDIRKSNIVELRFFGGLSIDETAEVLGVSPGTVMRDWTLAKAWLKKQMLSAD